MALTQVNLANMVTGVLPVANGGTGSSSALVPSGTYMLFGQTAAPTGWTKITANDNAALRIVSGSVSTGGSVNFTTAFASQAVSGTVGTSGSTTATGSVGSTTLSVSQIPVHDHSILRDVGGFIGENTGSNQFCSSIFGRVAADANAWRWVTANNGGGSSHNHSFTGDAHTHTGGTFTGTAINLAVKYVDVIMATKD